MPATRSLGAPNIRGTTVEEVRDSAQRELQRLYDLVNKLSGVTTTAQFYGPVDMGGNRVMRVAAPMDDTDAVPAGQAITRRRPGAQPRVLDQWDARGLTVDNIGDASQPQHAVPLHQVGAMLGTDIAVVLSQPFVVAVLSDILTAERALTAEVGVTTVTDNGANQTIVVGIAVNGIGNTQLRQGAATSVVGRAANSGGNLADIAAANDGEILRRAGGVLAFGLPSGVYTPGLTNVTNLAASTAYECQYLQLGATVLVSGRVDVDPTAAGATALGIDLPVASNIGAVEDCSGVAFSPTIAGQGAAIVGDAANNRAEMQWVAVDITNQPMSFIFAYQVL